MLIGTALGAAPQLLIPATVSTNPAAYQGGVVPASASPWYTTWWGILGLGVLGFAAYKHFKPQKGTSQP